MTTALERTPVRERRRVDVDAQALIGGRCTDCSTTVWPPRSICHRCGSDAMTDVAFARRGQLLSLTRVHVARPGRPAPYLLGQVRLSDGPVVFGAVQDVPVDTALPTDVLVAVGNATDHGSPYWFIGSEEAR